MGTCIVCENRLGFDISYSESMAFRIKERDRLGKVIRSDKVNFKLQLPLLNIKEELSLTNLKLEISSCMLSGIDPRSLLNKECQDNLLYIAKDSIFLGVVFDGHGVDGLKVVEHAKDYFKTYFMQNSVAFKSAPAETIKYMITECDKRVRNTSGIDCSVSGTTAIVMIITDAIHIGSVGDSRAVLAVLGSSECSLVRKKRHVEPTKPIFPMNLTVEQRPNIKEELERIKRSGGKVQQLTNEKGDKIGPYRIWRKKGTLPGLSMSRSIGDSIGKEIGVISTPICNSFMLDKANDQFIILATDGIWDVMSSQEVINFIDRFRGVCKMSEDALSFPIKPDKTTIAHLVAEEARVRWMDICIEEDVMIDDIAIIIIELKFLEPFGEMPIGGRQEIQINSLLSIADAGRMMASKGDAVRGSFVPAREIARRRIDPKRGSYVNENIKLDEGSPDLSEIQFFSK